MANQEDVILDPSPEIDLDENHDPAVVTDPPPVDPPGSQTDPVQLLKALKDERDKNKIIKDKLDIAERALADTANPTEDEEWSDEGRHIIDKFVTPLASQVTTLTEQLQLKDLIAAFPALKDKEVEFLEFRKSKPNYSLQDAAKIFITDNGLASTPTPRRKGLEVPRGGQRIPVPSEMTSTEIDELRTNDYQKYLKLLREGKINLDGNA